MLTTIGQSGDNISGRVQFSSLSGSGPFTGTIAANGHIRFTITNADDGYGPSDFDGYILPNGTMSGTYVNHSLNYKGNWQVHPPS